MKSLSVLDAREKANAQRRFWRRVEKTSTCWFWMGGKHQKGYGQFLLTWHPKATIPAHAFSYQLFKGPIPEGYEIDHLCRTPQCVNPDHLEAVPHRINSLRGLAGLKDSIKTHCPKGHPYSGANLYVNPKGHRVCRTCKKASYVRVVA